MMLRYPAMSRVARAAFVTIGQTPRTDLVPEMQQWLDGAWDIEEFGALDGLDRGAIAAMAPRASDRRLVTRLADGHEVVVRKDLVYGRLQTVFDEVAQRDFTCTVLLCTGQFEPFAVRGLFLDAQTIVDQFVAAIAHHAATIGLMVPLRKQIEEFHFHPRPGQRLEATDASPYTPGRLEQAARDLACADVIVMHCIGYTDAMRQRVATISQRPVLLARRLVASALAQLG
jgi:protein AroM